MRLTRLFFCLMLASPNLGLAAEPKPSIQRFVELFKGLRSDTCEDRLMADEFSKTPSPLGVVTDRVHLSVDSLIAAYKRGLFPWEISSHGAVWYHPEQRGILEFSDVEKNLSSNDQRFLRKALSGNSPFTITYDQAFKEVVVQCALMKRYYANSESGERTLAGTWISDPFVENYIALHQAGLAHSVEVWNDGKLVAGTYGVFVDGVFAGESMFHLVDDHGRSLPESNNAGKLAMWALITRLKENGHTFIDTQMVAGLARKWGAKLIARDEFMSRLRVAQKRNLKF